MYSTTSPHILWSYSVDEIQFLMYQNLLHKTSSVTCISNDNEIYMYVVTFWEQNDPSSIPAQSILFSFLMFKIIAAVIIVIDDEQ